MGERGPAPKRAAQRRRRNAPAGTVTKATTAAAVVVEPPDPEWHPSVLRWYESLGRSGQAQFYTATDWSTAWVAAEALSRELQPRPMKVGDSFEMVRQPVTAATFAGFLKACSMLLATEGDRRRVSMELDKRSDDAGREEAANVSNIAAWRSRTDGTG